MFYIFLTLENRVSIVFVLMIVERPPHEQDQAMKGVCHDMERNLTGTFEIGHIGLGSSIKINFCLTDKQNCCQV